jgi:hypothetical protein
MSQAVALSTKHEPFIANPFDHQGKALRQAAIRDPRQSSRCHVQLAIHPFRLVAIGKTTGGEHPEAGAGARLSTMFSMPGALSPFAPAQSLPAFTPYGKASTKSCESARCGRGGCVATSPWRTVDQLLRETRLSGAIIEILQNASPSRHFPIEATCDISSYVEQVVTLGLAQSDTSNAFVVEQLTALLPHALLRTALRGERPRGGDMRLSDGLGTVFEEAFDLRARTGGKDGWIGARHILACLLTSSDRDVIGELALATEPLGRLDHSILVPAIASLVTDALEEGESAQVWRSFFFERGFADAGAILPRLERPSNANPPSSRLSGNRPEPARRAREARQAARPPALTDPLQVGAVARVINDDVGAIASDRIVGSDNLAVALARVLVSKGFAPPLAVGVYGPWGSGKSLMMRRIQDEIGRVKQSDDDAFCSQIVEIRFNAWHYVDTDL